MTPDDQNKKNLSKNTKYNQANITFDKEEFDKELDAKLSTKDSSILSPINVQSVNNIEEEPNIDTKKQDQSKNAILAVISYFWLFSLIPFFTYGIDSFAKYHAKQGLLLAILITIWLICWWILFYFLNLPNWIIWAVNAALVLWIINGLINASNGKQKPLFLIGKIAEKW